MTLASDGKGNFLTLSPDGKQWVPAERAKNAAGDEMVRDGNEWKPVKPAAPPEDKYTIGNPMGDQGGADGSSLPPAKPTQPAAPAAKPARPWLDPETLLEGEVPGMVAGEPPPASTWQNWIDPSVQQSPNAGDLLPLSNEPGKGVRLTLPNSVRGLFTEGPQIRDGKLVVPGVTINPETGYLGVTPETTAAGSVPSALRFGRRVPTPPRNAIMPEVPPPDAPPPVTLEEVTAATRRAGPEVWRPVQPGEEPVPGRSYRMNQQTGGREVLEWGGGSPPRDAIEPSRNAIFPDEAARTGVREPDATITVRPEPGVEPEPQPGMGPKPAGAQATPSSLAAMDIDETKAARTTAEWQSLMETPQKGDATEYIRGVTPTRSEIELSAPKSVEAKLLRQEFREPYSDAEKAKMETIHNVYDDMAGTPTVVNSAERARDAVAAKKRAAMFEQGGTVDLQPMLDYEQTVLKSEDGRRPKVRDALRQATAEAMQGDKLVTDPELVYGVRKNINDMIDELDPLGKPKHARAMAQLLELRGKLDDAMDKAFPGQWKEYLNGYHEASKPIDVMKFLQERKANLTNGPDRTITFGKFDKLMKDIVIERGKTGIGPAEHLTDEQMATLKGIWKHLQRSASDQELARVRGSDTTQRMMELLRTGVLHVAAGVGTGGVANIAVPLVTRHMAERRAKRNLNRDLYPDLSKYPQRNAIMPDAPP